ncbi:glycoside hydrolase domain-containing protein [Bradyrhizobium sp. S69]|uniref:glycoside hydrolase domain-containing protein n=1 Tax=Bradyrhizobium sp. S69 TaxID=1641856 RepID=UPI00131DFB42|nr:glycoside hydrolase domain-containing protein [Bradyrhizobium sp. S69]
MSHSHFSRRTVLTGLGASALNAYAPRYAHADERKRGLAPAVQFVDMDHPYPIANKPLQQKFHNAGVKIIGRYYSHKPDPHHPTGCNVPGKVLTSPELDAIESDPDQAVITAFQFCNRCSGFGGNLTSQSDAMKYVSQKGRDDGQAAFDMAKALNQPLHTPIYFGVDFDPESDCVHRASWDDMRKRIVEYFRQVNAIVAPTWDIGVYGFGAACAEVGSNGYANYFWLSASVSHPGTRAFFNDGEWNIFQDMTSDTIGYAGIPNIDTDVLNPAKKTAGQWRRSGAVNTDQKAAADILAGRFFVTKDVCAYTDRDLKHPANGPASIYHWTARVVEATDKYIAASFNESDQAAFYFRSEDIKLGLTKNMPEYFSGAPWPTCHS